MTIGDVIGTIDYFWAAKLPYVHPNCALAFRIRFDATEAGLHLLNILIVDDDGRSIAAPGSLEIAVDAIGGEEVPILRHVVLQMKSLRFEKYGSYAAHVVLRGHHLASLPFSVVSPRQVSSKSCVSF